MIQPLVHYVVCLFTMRDTAEPIKVLDKAVCLLKALQAGAPCYGVRELARRTGINRSTTYRILRTLERHGLVMRDPETDQYCLGYMLLALANHVQKDDVLKRAAAPILQMIVQKVDETASLYVPLPPLHAVCITRLETTNPLRMTTRVGEAIPLGRGSASKVLLAFMARGREVETVETLHRTFPGLIPDPNGLVRELFQIQAQGYGISVGERVPHAASVSAPVLSPGGEVVACITVAGPASRFTPEIMRQILPVLMGAASQLAEKLWGTSPHILASKDASEDRRPRST